MLIQKIQRHETNEMINPPSRIPRMAPVLHPMLM
jgi:hypothetical protein